MGEVTIRLSRALGFKGQSFGLRQVSGDAVICWDEELGMLGSVCAVGGGLSNEGLSER